MIRVLVADDHPIVREGVKQTISTAEGMTVVAEATTPGEIFAILREVEVDVSVLDFSMPDSGGLGLVRRLRADHPNVPVIVLSTYPEEYVALRALAAGAAGYLTKRHPPARLVAAIRRVHSGRKYVTGRQAERLANHLGTGTLAEPHESLSEREFEILQRLGSGRTVGQIATELYLSPKTVSTYRSRVLKKLDLESTAQLIRYAVENEIVLPE